jgi:hypothetical protein
MSIGTCQIPAGSSNPDDKFEFGFGRLDDQWAAWNFACLELCSTVIVPFCSAIYNQLNDQNQSMLTICGPDQEIKNFLSVQLSKNCIDDLRGDAGILEICWSMKLNSELKDIHSSIGLWLRVSSFLSISRTAITKSCLICLFEKSMALYQSRLPM